MNRAVLTGVAAAALVAAIGGAFVADRAMRATGPISIATRAAAAPAGTPIYYRDPEGKPFYSLTPRKTQDGRDYLPVPAGADVSFDDFPNEETSTTASHAEHANAKSAERKIKYYRNPMGLPDTSPVPKKE